MKKLDSTDWIHITLLLCLIAIMAWTHLSDGEYERGYANGYWSGRVEQSEVYQPQNDAVFSKLRADQDSIYALVDSLAKLAQEGGE